MSLFDNGEVVSIYFGRQREDGYVHDVDAREEVGFAVKHQKDENIALLRPTFLPMRLRIHQASGRSCTELLITGTMTPDRIEIIHMGAVKEHHTCCDAWRTLHGTLNQPIAYCPWCGRPRYRWREKEQNNG